MKSINVEEIMDGFVVKPFDERYRPEPKRFCPNLEEVQKVIKNHFEK